MDKKPAEEQGWEEIGAEFYRFEKAGDTIEGVLLKKDVQVMRDAEVGRFEVELAEGKRVAFLGGVQLDRLMDDCLVGDRVKLVFQGKVKTSSGTEVKDFKLFRKPASTS